MNDFRCTCAPGFAGRFCTENVDECRSSPCRNDGTCVDEAGGFHCRCSPGFEGLFCEIDLLSFHAAGRDSRPAVTKPSRTPLIRVRTPLSSGKSSPRGSQTVGGGSSDAVSSVQPLLLVASFGLALPIVFVACAFAVWIHRRRRRRRQRAAAVAAAERPVEGLNNQRPTTTTTSRLATTGDDDYRPATTTTTDDRSMFVVDYDSCGGDRVCMEKNLQRYAHLHTRCHSAVDNLCHNELCHRCCSGDAVWYTHGSAGIVHW